MSPSPKINSSETLEENKEIRAHAPKGKARTKVEHPPERPEAEVEEGRGKERKGSRHRYVQDHLRSHHHPKTAYDAGNHAIGHEIALCLVKSDSVVVTLPDHPHPHRQMP